MARNQEELNQRKRDLEAFSLKVLEPLRVAHEQWKIAKAAEEAESPSPIDGELIGEPADDDFYDAIDINLAAEQASMIRYINYAIGTATNPDHKTHAPAIYHELVHIMGDTPFEDIIDDTTQLEALKAIVKKQEALSKAEIDLTIPRTPIQYFIAKQDEFIQEMYAVDEALSTTTTETEEQRAILQEYQWALQDLFGHYEAFKANADASSQRSIASFYETKEEASLSTTSIAPAPLPEPSFMNYIEAQRELSTLEPRMKQIKLSKKTLQRLEAPQKNIRHTPDLLSAIQKAEPASNPTRKDQFKATKVKTHREAKAVYLQVRTLRHFKQWDGKTSNAKQVDKQQAILRSLLQLNMGSVAELQKSNGRGPRDEVADFDTYLKTVLVDGYPEIFTLDAVGQLTVKLDEGQDWNAHLGGQFQGKNISAKDIEFALGLHEDEDGLSSTHSSPPLTQKMALNKLIDSDPENPLWAILKSMTPVSQSPMVNSKQLSLSEKVASYRDMMKRIEKGELGEFDKENRGLKAAKAIIKEIQYQRTHSTVLTPDIKEALKEMRPIIVRWENNDTDYVKRRKTEEFLDADSVGNVLTNIFIIPFRRLFSMQRYLGARGTFWNAERKYIEASTDCDELIKTIRDVAGNETASEISSGDGLDHDSDHRPGSDDGHDHPPADTRGFVRKAWDNFWGNQPDRDAGDLEMGSLASSVHSGRESDFESAAGSIPPDDDAESELDDDAELESSSSSDSGHSSPWDEHPRDAEPVIPAQKTPSWQKRVERWLRSSQNQEPALNHHYEPDDVVFGARSNPLDHGADEADGSGSRFHQFYGSGGGGGGGGGGQRRRATGSGGAPGGGGRRATGGGGVNPSRNLNGEKQPRGVTLAEPVTASQPHRASSRKPSNSSLLRSLRRSLRSPFLSGRQNTEIWEQVIRDHQHSIYDQKMDAVHTNMKQMLENETAQKDGLLLEEIGVVLTDRSQAHTNSLLRAYELLRNSLHKTPRADTKWGRELLDALDEAHTASISIDLTQGEVRHVDAHDVQRPRPRGELPSYEGTAIPRPQNTSQSQNGAHAVPTAQVFNRSKTRGREEWNGDPRKSKDDHQEPASSFKERNKAMIPKKPASKSQPKRGSGPTTLKF